MVIKGTHHIESFEVERSLFPSRQRTHMLCSSSETLVTLLIWPKSAASRFPLCKNPEVGLVLKVMEVTSPSPATLIGASGMAFGCGFRHHRLVTYEVLHHLRAVVEIYSAFYFSRVVQCFFRGVHWTSAISRSISHGNFWCFLPRFCFRDRDCNASYIFDGCWEQLLCTLPLG